MDIRHLAFGLIFSIVIGGIATPIFLYAVRGLLGLGDKPNPKGNEIKRVPPWLTGLTERLVFTILIALQITGTAPAMIAWLALKLVTNWNKNIWDNDPKAQPFAFTALLGGLVSMLFAAIGGQICAGKLWADLF